MKVFKPRFKEGSQVDIKLRGIVTAVLLGQDEEDTWYKVLSKGTNERKLFISCDVSERQE